MNLMPYFLHNELIIKDETVCKILDYAHTEVIPKRIVYANMNGKELEDYELECLESWKQYTNEFEFIVINAENCDLESAPEKIRDAYNSGNFEIVGNYFVCKYIHEKGGIAMQPCMKLLAPIGQLRMEKTFFSFETKTRLSKLIWGSFAKTDFLDEIFAVFSEANTADIFDIISDVLIYRYNLKPRGWTQTLTNGIKVFRADYLCYPIGKESLAEITNSHSYALKDTTLRIIEMEMLKYISDDRDAYWREKETYRKELDSLKSKGVNSSSEYDIRSKLRVAEGEIVRIKNSHSWKLTRWLRRIANFFRKNKYPESEVM